MAKIRAILWGGWYGSRNVGDQALLLSIADLLGDAIEDIEFVVITDNPSHVQNYTQKDSVHVFKPLHTRRQFFNIIGTFRKADLFIFGGGVPFYDDWFHSSVIVLFVTLSKVFRVPCVLWSVSSQKIRFGFTRLALRYLLSHASLVTYRDGHTRKLFLECGRNDALQREAADSVFTLRLGDKQKAREILERAGWGLGQARTLVALVPRLLRGGDGEAHIHYSPKTALDADKEIMVFASMHDWLWENGYQPIFVPMNTVWPDDDRDAAREIIRISKFGQNALLVDEQVAPRDAANVFLHCEAAFVARVHGAVTAFLGQCPVIMYAFDLKHAGIMEQMDAGRQIFDPNTASTNDAIHMMHEILQSREKYASLMREKARDLQEQAKFPRDAILRLLNGEE